MDVKGKVFQVLDPIVGTSAKGEWKKQEFVIETTDSQYPKKICFTVWSDKATIPAVGETANVHFNAESREYNGRWYTELSAWKIEGAAPSADAPEPQGEQQQAGGDSPLPF